MTRRHEPSERLRGRVEALTLAGVPQERIADLLDMDPKTLRKHYREELDCSAALRLGDVARNLFRIASTGSGSAAVSAAKFILTTKAGWDVSVPIEVTDEPLTREDMNLLTDEDLMRIILQKPLPTETRRRLRAIKGAPRGTRSH